jgi:predicted DNA-binding ribbon-helix-helix protein
MDIMPCIRKKQTEHHITIPLDYKPINYSHFKAKTRGGPSESISFRLSRNILDKLRQEARQKEISVDTLMTQIAKQHAEWHANASQIGFISVRKTLILKLLDEIRDHEKIKEIAREVARESSDCLHFIKEQHNVSIESALDFVEVWIKEAGYPYIHDISDVDRSIHHFVIQQDMGLKWSLYLSEILRNLFEELFNLSEVHFDVTYNIVRFTLDTNRVRGE